MQKTLVAFDANKIKGYVFGTDKLKEIRGASALLDALNRETMRREAGNATTTGIYPVYTNGGQGLFVVIAKNADQIAAAFGQRVQKQFTEITHGGASVTCVLQPLPAKLPDDIEKLEKEDLSDYFKLLQAQMEIAKGSPAAIVTLPSHPLMRLCDTCGIRYAEVRGAEENEIEHQYYCQSCRKKQEKDHWIKSDLECRLLQLTHASRDQAALDILNRELWERILYYLEEAEYDFYPFGKEIIPQRPSDFNAFQSITEVKEYIGLIYADANNMGVKVTQLSTLETYKKFAEDVDRAIHQAMSKAINAHLPVVQVDADDADMRSGTTNKTTGALFPFDIFLVGGDDIVMLTDAAKAMEVALTIGQEFRKITHNQHSLSIGVVMAPIKYPFRLMRGLVENVLKDAKQKSAQTRTIQQTAPEEGFDDTRISFSIVNGGMQINATDPYHKRYLDKYAHNEQERQKDFYATLRPYAPQRLDLLLKTIREGKKLNLGRTKLHQMREAILQMNTTSSVSESIAVLRNWNEKQRELIINYHRCYGALYQQADTDKDNPLAGLPRLVFPWFLEGAGQSVYRTALLDLVELYDFVAHTKGVDNG